MKVHKKFQVLLGVMIILAAVSGNGYNAAAGVTVGGTLQVTKDAFTSFDRTYQWSIEKTADQTDISLGVGETKTVTYTVTVDATPIDSNPVVTGTISVTNTGTTPAMLASLTDTVSPDITGTVNCDSVVFPYTLDPNAALVCPYTASLPDISDRLNTAKATLGTSSTSPEIDPSTVYTGTAEVKFGEPMNIIDDCITVSDSLGGDLGEVCAGSDTLPHVFTYTTTISPTATCGTNTIDNTASFVTDDTQTTGEITSTITVTTPCATCTLSQGYWKTHSSYGPAPEDETWALVGPEGADTAFFQSGQSWYEVLQTPPKKGNAYYIMSHQYIAARLNELNGVDISAVKEVLAEADVLLNNDKPTDTFTDEQRKQLLQIGETLDLFNNGLEGSEHCADEPDYTGPSPMWLYSLYSTFLPITVH